MAVTPRTVALVTRRWQADSPWNEAHGGPPNVSPKSGSLEHLWPGLAVHLGQASSQLRGPGGEGMAGVCPVQGGNTLLPGVLLTGSGWEEESGGGPTLHSPPAPGPCLPRA